MVFYHNKNRKLKNKTSDQNKWIIQGSTLKSMCHFCVKDIKKHFATFVPFAKMKLVPNVRDINVGKQIWLLRLYLTDSNIIFFSLRGKKGKTKSKTN
jgi:hypothetical protein